jgi:predicted nucleic acid-binding protein
VGFVLDSSVVLAWLLPDEASAAVDALADRLERESADVPAIWSLEVGNALLTAVRRTRITLVDVDASLAALAALPIHSDRTVGPAILNTIVALAARHGLTTYDASYIELAQRSRLPLATLDRKLREACAAAGVAVLP